MSRGSLLPAWLALGLLFVAPFLSGAKPPWVWGFLLAAILLLAACLLASEGLSRSPSGLLPRLFRGPLLWLHLSLAGLVIWATAHWVAGAWSLPGGLTTSTSTAGLAFVWAFAAAWMLGARLGLRARQLMVCVFVIWLGGVVCALWSLLAWSLRWPPEYFHWPLDLHRPSGPYMNANRFAVHLSIGLFSGLSLLALRFRMGGKQHPQALGVALLAGCVLIFIALCLTLSRLTILAVGLALGLGVVLWIARRLRRHRILPGRMLSLPERTRFRAFRTPLLGFLLLALAAAFMSFAHVVGQRGLAVRYTGVSSELEPDSGGRATAMKLGLRLFLQQPMGRGLGSFENAYRHVQPLEDTARWCEVHNDWLQTAIELGLPGVALMFIASLAWWALWWSLLRRRGFGFYFCMPLGLAVGVPVFCSLADFPLREPATGLQFFFLTGAVAAWLGRSARRFVPVGPALRAFLVSLAAVFVCWAVLALRVGCATWFSPWRGFIYPPPPEAEHADAYRRACEWAPGFKPLLIQEGLSLTRRFGTEADHTATVEQLALVADRIQAIDPQDYLAPLFRAHLCWIADRPDEAASWAERATELAPTYRDVRRIALQTSVQAAYHASDLKERAGWVERIRAHMRILLAVEPALEDGFTEQLRNLGLRPDEVAELWPRGDPASALPRARYWAKQRDWPRLEDDLTRFSDRQTPWLAAWQGRSHFMYGELERGLSCWQEAVRAQGAETGELRRWLGQEAQRLPSGLVSRWVELCVEDIANDAVLTLQLAPWLERHGQALRAERLMRAAMKATPRMEVFRYAAELALRSNDSREARYRAQLAWNLCPQDAEWSAWLAKFEERVTKKE